MKACSDKLVVLYKKIHHMIPAGFRHFLWRVGLVRSIWRIAHILLLNVWVITGEEILSKEKLSIIYIGGETDKNFINKLAFGDSYKEDYLGKAWLWGIFKTVKASGHACSLMVAEVSKSSLVLFGKKKCIYIPFWIRGEVDISVDMSSLLKSESLKSDLRRIRRNNLHFELTNELSQFHNFYHSMYLPYITEAHGNRAIIAEYRVAKKKFRHCDLLLIKKGKEDIAGVLIAYSKNGARLWSLGIKDGNLDYINDGAVGAIFYFSLLHLKEKGYKRVHLGGSRAFLKDGVLRYKKKWNQQIVSTSQRGFLINPLSKTVGMKGFLLNNPFIYVHKNRVNGAIFAEAGQSLSKDDFQKFHKDYYLPGISKLFIYQFEQGDSGSCETVPPEFSDKMTICSAESLF